MNLLDRFEAWLEKHDRESTIAILVFFEYVATIWVTFHP